jgi:hypothetical protein
MSEQNEQPDPLEQAGQSHAIRLGDDYDKSTDQKRISQVNAYIRRNHVFQENIFQAYDDVTGGDSPQATAFLYKKTWQLLGQIALNLEIDGEDDEAEKFREIRQRMEELVDPNELTMPLYESTEQLQHPTDKLERIIKEHGKELEEYAMWVFSNTQVTSEGTGGGSSGGNDDL